MAKIGEYNTLKVVKEVDFGVYLDGGNLGEVLLPKRYVPSNCQVENDIEVFIYLDSEDRLVATTEKPLAGVGEFASLEVVSVSDVGAFLDWGLPKDLLLPHREQKQKVTHGQKVFVYVYLDLESKRLVATAKIEKNIDNLPVYYQPGDEVDVIIWAETDLGYKVVIENLYSGMLYRNEVFQPLEPGQKLLGYVKKVREDEKIDISLYKPGYEKIDTHATQILKYLKENNGYCPLGDKSPADEIANTFNISKKTFKKAIGNLYKEKLIRIEPNGIKLIN
jgi:predicted RNA-binding protein (virulence factor B family)